MEIRLAKLEDCKEILQIYKPYVEATNITFEYIVPSLEEFEARFVNISSYYPYLVAIENNKIVGYAYASSYRSRKAYDWTCELSIYLDNKDQGKGTGTKLYQILLDTLKLQGFFKAYACITYPNPGSIAFHEKYRFKHLGTFPKAGYKFDKWLDITWMELNLQADKTIPSEIISINELPNEVINKLINA